jgi:hypothetical protein
MPRVSLVLTPRGTMPKTIVLGSRNRGDEDARPMTTPEYALEPIRKGADSTLYRGRQRGSSPPPTLGRKPGVIRNLEK